MKNKNKASYKSSSLEIFKKSLTGGVFKITGLVLGYFLALIVARQYGAEGSGTLALVMVYLTIGSVLGKFGLDVVVMKYTSRYVVNGESHKVQGFYFRALKMVVFFSVLSSVLFFSLAPWIAKNVFSNENLEKAFILSSLMIVFLSITQLHAEALKGYKAIALHFLISNNLVPLFAIIFILIGINVEFSGYQFIDAYFFSILLTFLISFLLWFWVSDRIKEKESLGFLHVIKESLPIMITSSFTLLMGWLDIIMIGFFLDEKSVGVYAIAMKLAMLTSLSLIVVNSIVAPKISQAYSLDDKKGMQDILTFSTKLIFWIAFPVLVCFMIFPSFFLSFFGEEFLLGVSVLMILTVGQFINAVCGPVGQVLNMTDRQIIFRNIVIFAAVINGVLNYFLIPLYGINGAAVATTISLLLWNLISVFYIYKRLNLWAMYRPFIRRSNPLKK